MKALLLVVTLALFSWPVFSVEITEAEATALYDKWQAHMWAQEWEEALPCLVGVIIFANPPGDPRDNRLVEWDSSNNLFYDAGLILMQLDRWTEAKYCFTRHLVWYSDDSELERLFGDDFSLTEWFAENRLEAQPFYLEFIASRTAQGTSSEQADDAN